MSNSPQHKYLLKVNSLNNAQESKPRVELAFTPQGNPCPLLLYASAIQWERRCLESALPPPGLANQTKSWSHNRISWIHSMYACKACTGHRACNLCCSSEAKGGGKKVNRSKTKELQDIVMTFWMKAASGHVTLESPGVN